MTAWMILLGLRLHACTICLPYPVDSLADHILSSKALCLAREDPDRPFILKPVRHLISDEDAPEIDLFLDSSTRRKLMLAPDKSVLCGLFDSTDGPEWRRLAIHHDEVAPVVKTIINQAEHWRSNPAERSAYFATYLGHDHPTLSDLAHLEVARAPYTQIREHAKLLDRDEIVAFLADFRRLEWHPLYILFLAQSDDPRDHERIRDSIATSAELHSTLLTAAWATALIEIDGPEAIQWLGDQYTSGRSPEETRCIFDAMAVQGTSGSPEMRAAIIPVFRSLLVQSPALAPSIAGTLSEWESDQLVAELKDLLTASPEAFDLTATTAIRSYLRKQTPTTSKSRRPGYLWTGLMLLAIPLFLALKRQPKSPQEPSSSRTIARPASSE
ncbi:MAG: hypothetical protein ACPG4K_07320 [Haloferula sp.]